MLTPTQHKNILDHAAEVQLLHKGGPHAKALLAAANPNLVRAIAHMVRHGHNNGLIHVAHAAKHAAKIAKLSSPTSSQATKTKVVQGGGFLGFLGPILGGLAGAIFGKH